MTPVEIVLLYLAVAMAAAAFLLAGRAYGIARRADAKASHPLMPVVTTDKPAEPSREERIAWARGEIEACRGAELALAEHAREVGPALMLAQYRANAARARQALRLLGVES